MVAVLSAGKKEPWDSLPFPFNITFPPPPVSLERLPGRRKEIY
jgi:hypothetical protein